MGTVYLAHDTTLGRPVTLKVLHPDDGADPSGRSACASRRARPPASRTRTSPRSTRSRTSTASSASSGEYVPGRTARELLERGPLELATVMRVATRRGARARRPRTAAGLLHRDLKPENILVGDNGVTRVLDFGIARAIGARADRPRLTETGMVVGTPGYISPEQLEGGAGDARSDVFALGIVLYELVTGTNPFQGPTPASTAARILTLEPPAPSRVNPISPPALDAIVARCLRKDPAARYASAADVLADLERSRPRWTLGDAARPRACGSRARAAGPRSCRAGPRMVAHAPAHRDRGGRAARDRELVDRLLDRGPAAALSRSCWRSRWPTAPCACICCWSDGRASRRSPLSWRAPGPWLRSSSW